MSDVTRTTSVGAADAAQAVFDGALQLIDLQARAVQLWLRVPVAFGMPESLCSMAVDNMEHGRAAFAAGGQRVIDLVREIESTVQHGNLVMAGRIGREVSEASERLNSRVRELGDAAEQAALEMRAWAGQQAVEVVPHNVAPAEMTRGKRTTRTG